MAGLLFFPVPLKRRDERRCARMGNGFKTEATISCCGGGEGRSLDVLVRLCFRAEWMLRFDSRYDVLSLDMDQPWMWL